jgi:hypothetical protein
MDASISLPALVTLIFVLAAGDLAAHRGALV